MADIDLDIRNYTYQDIECLFQIPADLPYTTDDVEMREYEIRQRLLSSNQMNKRIKRDVVEFLDQAKQLLITKLYNSTHQPPPTAFPPPEPTLEDAVKQDYQERNTYVEKSLDNMDYPRSAVPPPREEELVKRQETGFVYTNASEYFPGALNPLNTRVISRCLNIDTRFRDNVYTTQSSDFTVQLPTRLTKVVSMQMSSLEFPVSFYGISANYGNNFIYITTTYMEIVLPIDNGVQQVYTPITTSTVLVVPDGNYENPDLITKLNSLLAPRDVLSGNLINPHSPFNYMSFSLDISGNGSGSGKVSLTASGDYKSNIRQIQLDFTRDICGNVDVVPLTSKLGWNLGFNEPTYSGSATYNINNVLVKPASITGNTPIEATATRYVYLAIDDFNNSANNHFISAFNSSIFNPNIIAKIAIRGNYFGIIDEKYMNIVTEPRQYFGPVNIQRLHIRVYDDHGRILNMNNGNFSFCVIFKTLYDL